MNRTRKSSAPELFYERQDVHNREQFRKEAATRRAVRALKDEE